MTVAQRFCELPAVLGAWESCGSGWATVMAVGLPFGVSGDDVALEGSFLPSPPAAVNMAIRRHGALGARAHGRGLPRSARRSETAEENSSSLHALPKIRDENDRSCSLETYLSRHAGIKLSHGLCPDCASQFYPDTFPPERDSA